MPWPDAAGFFGQIPHPGPSAEPTLASGLGAFCTADARGGAADLTARPHACLPPVLPTRTLAGTGPPSSRVLAIQGQFDCGAVLGQAVPRRWPPSR